MNTDIIGNTTISLPPPEEQKAIVSKVEKLFAFCDELEKQISKSRRESDQLMQSVLKEAFREEIDVRLAKSLTPRK